MPFSKRTILFIFFLILISVSLFALHSVLSDELIMTQITPLKHLIRCYKKGNGGENILLIGCIHGNEKAGILISMRVLNEIFARNEMQNTLICIPTVNPDGNVLNTRTNSNMIDINRNFPARNWVYVDSAKLIGDKKYFWGGNSPTTETETKFILKVDSLYHPDAFIILHQFLNCVQYDGTGIKLGTFISKYTKQKLLDNIGYKTEGSVGSYFGDDKQKEVVTIELPENPSDSLQQNLVNALVDAVAKGYKN
jgi:protein MpaA